jgi:uncharacterized protein (TIGR03083 family)
VSVALPDRDVLLEALRETTGGFSTLLRRVEDGSVRAIGEWTVADVAAHLSHGFTEVYLAVARGEGSAVTSTAGIAGMNEAHLNTDGERDPRVLADRIDEGHAEFQDCMSRLPPGAELTWHARIVLPAATMVAIVLGEVLIHGYDVAKASGQTWPIGAERARMAMMGVVPPLPHYADRAATEKVQARVLLRLRGPSPKRNQFVMVVDRGTLTIEELSDGVDCRISAAPAAFMLVSYGRISPLLPSLTGKILAYGRKPWLGLRLTTWLTNP